MRTDKIRTVFLTILLLFVMFLYLQNLKHEYSKKLNEYKTFVKKAERVVLLEDRWSNPSKTEKSVRNLKRRFKPKIFKKEAGKYIMEFTNLTKSGFGRLAGYILNSNLKIEKLDLKREGMKGSIYLEVGI